MRKISLITMMMTFAACMLHAESGVYLGSGSSMQNSIVWGNAHGIAGAGTTTYTATDSNAVVGTGNFVMTKSPFVGTGLTGLDKYNLASGSAVINAGTSVVGALGDVAGYDRVWGPRIDLGAYEYQFPRIVTVSAIDTFKIINGDDPSLAYSVQGDALLEGDELEVALTRIQGEAANTYAINGQVKILRPVAGIDVTQLYALTFNKATFTIRQATDLPDIEQSISVYPTVTSGVLYVRGIENDVNLSVYNLSGIQVMYVHLTNLDHQIDTSPLKPGAYFLRVTNNKRVETIKFIKK